MGISFSFVTPGILFNKHFCYILSGILYFLLVLQYNLVFHITGIASLSNMLLMRLNRAYIVRTRSLRLYLNMK